MDDQENLKIKETNNYLNPSDIVNGSANLYEIKEKEMEAALRDIYREIGYVEMDLKQSFNSFFTLLIHIKDGTLENLIYERGVYYEWKKQYKQNSK